MFDSIRTLIKGVKDAYINNIRVSGDITIDAKGVYVNGKRIESSDMLLTAPKISIRVIGDVSTVDTTQGDVTVEGNAGSVETTQGNIDITGHVTGSVKTTQGDVTVGGNVSGAVTTRMGDITITAKARN